jgi:hypothetical protein
VPTWTIGGWFHTILGCVEACSSIKACKYLFKYVHKGHDRASYSVDPAGVINEIRQYRDARFISPPEAVHRITSLELGMEPNRQLEMIMYAFQMIC